MFTKSGSYIIKVTGNCNLYCPYCYHFSGKKRVPKSTLSIDLLESFIEQAVELTPDKVWFIWHGGEPLLAGIDYFKRIVAIEERITAKRGTKFRNSIQTNATLVNHQWADFFQAHDFGVGVSLDGTKEIHDRNRVYFSQKGSFDQTIKNIHLLQDTGLRIGILAVVTKSSLGKEREILDYFLQIPVRSFNFLPCVEIAENDCEALPFSITDNDYAEFMINMFDLWTELDDPSVRVRYFNSAIIGLLGLTPPSCTFNGTCGNYVTLNNDGGVFPCDNFINYKELKFGNLQESSLDTLLKGDVRHDFYEASKVQRAECEICDFQTACHGACRKYSYIFRKKLSDPNFLCGSRKVIFSHIAGYLEENIAGYKRPSVPKAVNLADIKIN